MVKLSHVDVDGSNVDAASVQRPNELLPIILQTLKGKSVGAFNASYALGIACWRKNVIVIQSLMAFVYI